MKASKIMVSIRLQAKTRAWFKRAPAILSYRAMCAWCEACPVISAAWLANDVRGIVRGVEDVMAILHAKKG